MTIEIRRARPDELTAVVELDGANFGGTYSEQEAADALLELDPAEVFVAVEDGGLIGVCAELPLRMSVPDGDLAVPGLTWVSVEVTHRRRGVLRSMIEGRLRDRAAAGCAAMVLTASEGGIYGRYGFGVASQVRRIVIDRRRARLANRADASAVRRLPTGRARPLLADLYERWRAQTPGAVSRDATQWDLLLRDRVHHLPDWSGLFHLVHPDGYVSYRLRGVGDEGEPAQVCRLVDYAPVTPAAHAALWQTVLGLDLAGTIESDRVPLDDPLPLLLTDYRRVETASVRDGLWLRPLDVPLLLGSRSYGVEVDTVVQVADRLLGDGRYHLRGGPDGSVCERTDRDPDVALDVAALGAAVLGGVRLGTLGRAGLATGDPAAIARLDRALLADRLPSHGTHF